MPESEQDQEYGHALNNTLGLFRLYQLDKKPEEARKVLMRRLEKDLRTFGTNFIKVLKDNPNFPSLNVSDEELEALVKKSQEPE